MGREFIASIVTVLTAIVGLAIVATLVSKNADTATVIGTSGKAFSGIIGEAESPVSGAGAGALMTGMLGGNYGYLG